MNFDRNIVDLDSQVIFFPVRHHSPTCARLIRELASEIRPQAILIEAPFDFNEHIEQLYLAHQLPIAIYSYLRLSDDTRRGAFYPFCVYSPEWQGLQIAKELNIAVEFIDLPWAEIAGIALTTNRYGDREFRQNTYVANLCTKLGVKDLNELWDLLFEIDPHLTLTEYLDRSHQFCFHSRLSDGNFSPTDIPREEFMANCINKAMSTYSGQILVVTGGLHSYALFNRIHNLPLEQFLIEDKENKTAEQNLNLSSSITNTPQPTSEKGIALTPYDYQRLDALTGYDAGMPNPGFYHQIWCDRIDEKIDTYRQLLIKIVQNLRENEQIFSSADLIAVEMTAKNLAALRSHAVVWRQDLIDSIVASLIKESLDTETIHPYLQAVYEILCGDKRGYLAKGTLLPPLVQNIYELLHQYKLEPDRQSRVISLNLEEKEDLKRSQILHQLSLLAISGYQKTAGTDLITRQDLSSVWEEWEIISHPHYEASCIENAIYGTTLAEASEAKLVELAFKTDRNAEKVALLVLDACLMGLIHLTDDLFQQLLDSINSDHNFLSITGALGHLLYLYRYDEILGTANNKKIGIILTQTCDRALWLLEMLGTIVGKDRELLQSLKTLLETIERCQTSLNLDRTGFINILERITIDSSKTPLIRGAATGILWTLNTTTTEQIKQNIIAFGEAQLLGDFLTGLFFLGRELVQRHPDLLISIDELIISYDEETFLEALPSLHLAFTYFTPREKHNIATTLTKTWNTESNSEQSTLKITTEIQAQAKAFEAKLLETIKQYGLRG